jgi:hypothetical protein
MPRRKLDTSMINTKRLELIHKGHLTVGDVKEFVPCGHNKASQIFKEIRQEVKDEGLENCSNVILVKRILKYLGLTVEGVTAAAKLESRGL